MLPNQSHVHATVLLHAGRRIGLAAVPAAAPKLDWSRRSEQIQQLEAALASMRRGGAVAPTVPQDEPDMHDLVPPVHVPHAPPLSTMLLPIAAAVPASTPRPPAAASASKALHEQMLAIAGRKSAVRTTSAALEWR